MSWRLLRHPPADGAWNMAVDEAILETYVDAQAALPPTLRLYAFKPPALSLGRRQHGPSCHDPLFLRNQGITLVRRPTGGGAVLHEHELTYAVIARTRQQPFPGGVLDTYRSLAMVLADGLARLGLAPAIAPADPAARARQRRTADPACFAQLSSHEIEVRGRKLVGSAQLRRKGAFLQHGSILLRSQAQRLAKALGRGAQARGFTDLEQELGVAPDADRLADALVEAFESHFASPLVAGRLGSREALRAHQLSCWKYGSTAWTLEGRPGLRERRWDPSFR